MNMHMHQPADSTMTLRREEHPEPVVYHVVNTEELEAKGYTCTPCGLTIRRSQASVRGRRASGSWVSCPLCELALNEAADLLDATNPEAAEYYRHLYD